MTGTWTEISYTNNAVDAALPSVVHLWSPSGIYHNPSLTVAIPPDPVMVHELWARIFTTTYTKRGVPLYLVAGTQTPNKLIRLCQDQILSGDIGVSYKGPPFLATNGIGWTVYKPGIADTNVVELRMLVSKVRA